MASIIITLTGDEFYIATDNLVKVVGLKDVLTDEYINDATVKMSLFHDSPLSPDADGAVTDKGGGKVGIPVAGHGLVGGDYIRIAGTLNYDDEYTVDNDTTENEIVISHAYEAETLIGTESIYKGVKNGTALTLSYVESSNGDYQGILSDTLKGIVERSWYYLFVQITKETTKLTSKLKWKAVYHLSQVNVST